MSHFNPPKIQCNNCKDIVYSKYPGQFVACTCMMESQLLCHKISEDRIAREVISIDSSERDRQEHQIRCQVSSEYGKGIFIDSTKEYTRMGGMGIGHSGAGYTTIDEGDEDGDS